MGRVDESHLGLAGAAVGDIGRDGVAEEAGVLGHHPYLAAVPLGIHLCQGHPINQHLSTQNCVQGLPHLVMIYPVSAAAGQDTAPGCFLILLSDVQHW